MRIQILTLLLLLSGTINAQRLQIWFDHDVDVAYQFYHPKTMAPETPKGKKIAPEVIFRGSSREMGLFDVQFAGPCEFIVASPERFEICLDGDFPPDAVVSIIWKPGDYHISFDPYIGVVVSHGTF